MVEESDVGAEIITTGDIDVLVEVENVVNVNETEIANDSEVSLQDDDVEVVEVLGSEDEDEEGKEGGDEMLDSDSVDGDINIEVSNDNEADLKNDVEIEMNTGENEITSSSSGAIIVTGDIDGQLLIDNSVNDNETIIGCSLGCSSTSTSVDELDLATTTLATTTLPAIIATSTIATTTVATTTTATTTINLENTNNASTTNDISVDSNTGNNLVAGGDEVDISTGDINIVNVLINFINKNVFGAGKEFFVNIFDKTVSTIDLSSYEDEGEVRAENEGVCEANDCLVSITNKNNGEIENNIIIEANTGSNLVGSTASSSAVNTGDINIINDVLNIANVNISGDEWFFAVVNIFGSLEGDILLPGIDDEVATSSGTSTELSIEEIFEMNGEESSEVVITNTSDAEVLNNINIDANTGSNTSSTTAEILTGDVNVESHIFNLVNYNIVGDTWKFAKVNVFGNWEGFIHGLPEGYGYYEDEEGITIYNDFLDNPIYYEEYSLLMVENENKATTTNNIEIKADTGNNSILHSEDGGVVSTGHINIRNSLVNFINSNFIGNNWEFSMINVFGEWIGNLGIGQPDLWITESISPAGPVEKGDYVTYTYLFGNNGDGMASNVIIVDDFDHSLFQIMNKLTFNNEGGVAWSIDKLPPNSQGSVSYTVQVRENIPFGENVAENNVEISSFENDRDYSNNFASGFIIINGGEEAVANESNNDFAISSHGDSSVLGPNLSVIKYSDANEIVEHGDIVNFSIVIKNTGMEDALEVYALDVMTNTETGEEVNRQFWNLETVYKGEEIVIDYKMEIGNEMVNGTYINEVLVEGLDSKLGQYNLAVASHKIRVVNEELNTGNLILATLNARNGYVIPGEVTDFDLLITNHGKFVATNTEVSITLPDMFHLVEDEETSTSTSWNVGRIESGTTKIINFRVLVDETVEVGMHENEIEFNTGNYGGGIHLISLEVRVPVLVESFTEAQEVELIPITTMEEIEEEALNELPQNTEEEEEEVVMGDMQGPVFFERPEREEEREVGPVLSTFTEEMGSTGGNKYNYLMIWALLIALAFQLTLFFSVKKII